VNWGTPVPDRNLSYPVRGPTHTEGTAVSGLSRHSPSHQSRHNTVIVLTFMFHGTIRAPFRSRSGCALVANLREP